jgi:hypothetical protein
LTLPRSVLAGLLAGLCEGALAVTPSEAIKTRLIEDGRKPKAERLYKVRQHTQAAAGDAARVVLHARPA